MTDELPDTFSDFSRGVISPATFEHALLALCKSTPDRAWEALALLDQHFRRGKIAPELQYSLRHRIERQALGIESYQPERAPLPEVAVARAMPVAPDADAEDPTIETIVVPEPPVAAAPPPTPGSITAKPPPRVAVLALERIPMRGTTIRPQKAGTVAASIGWRPYFRVSCAIALTAVVLAFIASPTVENRQYNLLTLDRGTPGTGAAGAVRSDSNAATSANPAVQRPDTISLSSDRYIADPDSGVAELSVERSADAAGNTSFLWWTEGSGAKPDKDYVAGKPRRVQMAEGVGSSTLRIPLLANQNRRHVEMFYVLIGRPEGNTGVGPIHRAAVFLLPQHAR